MSLTVLEDVSDVDHWIIGQRSLFNTFIKGFLHSSDILIWNRGSDHFVFKSVRVYPFCIGGDRLHVPYDLGELSRPSRLLFMEIAKSRLFGYGLPVIDGWFADFHFDIILSPHSFCVDLQM